MKIGIDARWIFPEITGIGSYTQELIRHLALVDNQNEYILYYQHDAVRQRTRAYAELDQHANFRERLIPYGPFSARSQIQFPGEIRRDGLDIYHSTNFMMPFPGFPANRRGKTACIVTIHDLIPLLFPEHTPKALKSRFHGVYRWVMRQVGQRADLILTVSESSKRDIIEHMHVPPERVKAIYEGVSDRFVPVPRRPRDEKVILYVGRLDPYKNVVGLLRAFNRLRREGQVNCRLRLIGPPDDRYPDVKQLIDAEGLRPHIEGPAYASGEELLDAYQQADLFVLPSLYEGFGLPVLEAMACGTPVICSNRASLPEVAGDAAVLVDPTDETELLGALRRVLTDEGFADSLRQKSLARAAQFSWLRTAQETIAQYQEMR
jgi:glycosyltransferase involved in cell wall biosynthesis